ncbi:MAG: hypothetical protein E6J79_04720, partial [Deltaproteobacteria bacterium]
MIVRILAVTLLVPALAAADVSVRATLDPTQVRVGEASDLSVEVDGAQNAVGPSTQVSIVNGRMTASITHRYSVVASQPGRFTIGPITVEYNGKTYDAGSVALEVAAAGAPAGGGQAAAPAGDQLRLALSAPRTEVYVGERVPIALTLTIGQVRVTDLQYPTIAGDGFALDKLPEPSQRREGAAQVVEFRTTLVPMRSGALTIGPATMSLSLLVHSRSADPFFGSFFGDQRRPMELHSEPVALAVLPLPEAGRPADFSGAIGHFQFDVKAAPAEVAVGDPVTITSTISGDGALDALRPPAIAASDRLRVYPVQVANQPAANAGEKVFEQVVIPLAAGTVALPDLRFSYFDPGTRSYQTVDRPPIVLTVHESAAAHAAPQITGGVAAPGSKPERLGRDIVFIKDAPGQLRPIGARRWRSPVFWLFQLVPLAVWLGALAVQRRRQRLSGDVRYARYTRAGRDARAAIARARAALRAGDRATFHDMVAGAVHDYLAAKLDLPPGAVTAQSAAARLRGAGLATDVAAELEAFFTACEQARFAPAGADGADMQRTLERADAIVRALERERRLGRSLIAASLLLITLARATHAMAPAETPNTIFFHANALYGEERWAEAAAEYERVLAVGWESGNLYFNLGNAWFRAGDVGRAVLDYERARRLIPRDPDLHANLSYARELTGNTGEDTVWARLVFPLAGHGTTDELLAAASAVYVAMMALLAVALFVPVAAQGARWAAAVAGLALVVVLSSAGRRLATLDLPAWAVVVTHDEATVRFEPSA